MIDLVLRGRPRDLGGLTVRRALPAAQIRHVGPFVFWDHMGPVQFAPGQGIDVRPHPHVNLATVTYLFEGEIVHKDSLGSDQAIRPGDVNWMTAGRGIVHSERTGDRPRREGSRVHGIQSWVALPVADEETAPSFHHYEAESLPEVALPGAVVRVLVGAAYGRTSPVKTFAPTLYVEARLEPGAELELPDGAERALYVVEGAVTSQGRAAGAGEVRLDEGAMGIVAAGAGGAEASVRAEGAARVMVIGGAPLDGPRHIWWNFVSSSEERIERAKRDWKEGRFGTVPGDEKEFIPLPD
jgi:redox-sensitive bicupin YhaK (pirin superfamily)